jgi:hypothetical protein
MIYASAWQNYKGRGFCVQSITFIPATDERNIQKTHKNKNIERDEKIEQKIMNERGHV